MAKNLYDLHVAAVLGNGSLVLNAGSADGVRIGMTFVIYALGDEIRDPASGESLGRVELVKANVTVVHVQEKMSTATSTGKMGSVGQGGFTVGGTADGLLALVANRVSEGDRAKRTS